MNTKSYVFRNSPNGVANGITLGEALLISMENMSIQACTVNYGQIFQNKSFNFQIIVFRIILANLSRLMFQDKFSKDTF